MDHVGVSSTFVLVLYSSRERMFPLSSTWGETNGASLKKSSSVQEESLPLQVDDDDDDADADAADDAKMHDSTA